MRKLFMMSAAALLAAMGIGCTNDKTGGPDHAPGSNPNAVSVYVKPETGGDYTPVICTADKEHVWFQCVVKNGASFDGGKSFPTWTIGGVWTNALDWDRKPVSGNVNIAFDSYGGDVVGVQADAASPIYFSILPEGTLIDENLAWVKNSTYTEDNDRAPYIWSSQSPETNNGQSGYVVGKFWYEDEDGGNGDFYRGWLRVTVSEGSVKLGGMCLCLGGGEFHTGEMPVPGSRPEPEPKPLEFRLLAPVVEGEINFPPVTINNNNVWRAFTLPGDGATWGVAGLWGHQISWADGTETGATCLSLENYGGDVVGTQPGGASGPIYFSILPEGTQINDKMAWVQNTGYVSRSSDKNSTTWQHVPRVWDSENPTINKGESGYIVGKFHYRHDAKKIPDGYYPGWLKVDVAQDGSVTASGMCICIGEGEFRTGQLPENPYPKPDPVGDYVMVNIEGADDFQMTMNYRDETQFINGKLGNTYTGVGLVGGTATWGRGLMTQSWGGQIVGTKENASNPMFYTVLAVDTEITDEMSWLKPGTDSYDELVTVSSENLDNNKGKSGYLVGTFPYENKTAGIKYAFHRGWIEVDIAASGAVTYKRMCVCLNDNLVFKTGQTEGTATKPVKKIFEVFTGGWEGQPYNPITGEVSGRTYANFAIKMPSGMWEPGGIWAQTMAWAEGGSSSISGLNIAIDNYGCPVVGTRANASAPIYFTVLAENTTIDNTLAWVDNDARNAGDESKKGMNGAANFCMTPYVWSTQSPEINKGQSGYIVGRFSYGTPGSGAPSGFYRAWIKVAVDAQGGVVNFDRMYICTDDNLTFKTGQTAE